MTEGMDAFESVQGLRMSDHNIGPEDAAIGSADIHDLHKRVSELEKTKHKSSKKWWRKTENVALLLSVASLGATLWGSLIDAHEKKVQNAKDLGVQITDTQLQWQAASAQLQRTPGADSSDAVYLNAKRVTLVSELMSLLPDVKNDLPASLIYLLASEEQQFGDDEKAAELVDEALQSKNSDIQTTSSAHVGKAYLYFLKADAVNMDKEYQLAINTWDGHQDPNSSINKANLYVGWAADDILLNRVSQWQEHMNSAAAIFDKLPDARQRSGALQYFAATRSNMLTGSKSGQQLLDQLVGSWNIYPLLHFSTGSLDQRIGIVQLSRDPSGTSLMVTVVVGVHPSMVKTADAAIQINSLSPVSVVIPLSEVTADGRPTGFLGMLSIYGIQDSAHLAAKLQDAHYVIDQDVTLIKDQ